jgi:hypothetical protein
MFELAHFGAQRSHWLVRKATNSNERHDFSLNFHVKHHVRVFKLNLSLKFGLKIKNFEILARSVPIG